MACRIEAMATNAGSRGEGVLISCDPESRALAVEEIAPLLPGPLEWLDAGIALGRTEAGFDSFAAAVEKAAPVFVRHIAPAEVEIPLTAADEDLDRLKGVVSGFAGRVGRGAAFSVQSRILGEGNLPYRKVAVNETLSRHLETATGAKMDARRPELVVSILCTPDRGFLGVSRTAQNRSAWPGGMHRFRHEEGRISRSEHKLLEALSVFGIELPEKGTALDMGAAPGGWTRVLRQRGLEVVAVDPAELDARLGRDEGVVHVRQRIQEYRPGDRRFEVIVNDMRMDAPESVEIMLRARPWLKDGGAGVLTLKLPKRLSPARRTLETVRGLVSRLAQGYAVRGVRQLYHNRSEVTVALAGEG